jgi:putative hydrolase of HD superfamily
MRRHRLLTIIHLTSAIIHRLSSMPSRLSQQIRFILEVDKLKQILRQTLKIADRQRENDAEHSWHLALMVLVLAEHANRPDLDVLKVLGMVIIHDLVEIDAGDTFVYDEAGMTDKAEREQKAADRIFGLLPDDQEEHFRALWEEFEERESPEARFAAALDRLQPVLQNINTDGHAWKHHGIRHNQVLDRNRHMAEGSEAIWEYARAEIQKAVDRGDLLPSASATADRKASAS